MDRTGDLIQCVCVCVPHKQTALSQETQLHGDISPTTPVENIDCLQTSAETDASLRARPPQTSIYMRFRKNMFECLWMAGDVLNEEQSQRGSRGRSLPPFSLLQLYI